MMSHQARCKFIHIAIAVAITALGACGGDEYEPTPSERDALLDAIGESLCEQQATHGSVFTGRERMVLTDCP